LKGRSHTENRNLVFLTLRKKNMPKGSREVYALGLHITVPNFKMKFSKQVHNAPKCKPIFKPPYKNIISCDKCLTESAHCIKVNSTLGLKSITL
jgi:hypothetical protein